MSQSAIAVTVATAAMPTAPARKSPTPAWTFGVAVRIAAATAGAMIFEVLLMILFMVGSFLVLVTLTTTSYPV